MHNVNEVTSFDDPILDELAERLTSTDAGIRRVAAMELIDVVDPRAVELLLIALKDQDASVRQEAAKVIDEFEPALITDALVDALLSPDENVRNAAAHALADLKDTAAVPALIAALERNSDDVFVVASILRALKPLTVAEAKPVALRLLSHASANVRREAVGVLGYLRQEDTLPALIQLANSDPDDEVRRIATGTLRFGSTSIVTQPLVQRLHDSHWQVRVEAAASLGRLTIYDSIPALIAATTDEFWQVREKAAESLGKLQAVAAIPALAACATDPMGNLRKAAVAAMGEIADISAKPYLEEAFNDADPDVRKLARWAYTKLPIAV